MTAQTHSVILTHEHTDFDALASLLGAALLFSDTIPVLPYQLNRNVSEFLALYRNQFPFVEAKELPRGQVAQVILVDTRKANLPKGIHDETRFQIIDHHSVEEHAAKGHHLWSDSVGANTTLLVEKLIERQIAVTSVQATLLALGIHEDTGSLTYAATTYRDVTALAWLMQPERGVNLQVLSHFLQHPLGEAQRTLLQILIDQSAFYECEGHTVVIACAKAPAYESELSTLAHRLRNFHECDALFMVVDLGELVQVVARSSTDGIDVGAIARELGGGGHTRAAAASLHETTPEQIREEILRLLGQQDHTTITVRQIMSIGRPQMMGPDQSIDDVAVLMRRYGHEGFPVVAKDDEGKERLLGVITRREADRAINHGLGDAPVRRFMQAGEVTVRPSDSVQQLRQRMIESSWGQIPVVDDQGVIIGIVTRTDLIKLWDGDPATKDRKAEIDKRLHTLLAPAQYRLLQRIGVEVDEMDFAVYIVGGFVRDLLLNGGLFHNGNDAIDALDMDIVIEGDAVAFAEHVRAQYGGRIVVHRRFGTAKWLLNEAAHPVAVELLLAPVEHEQLPNLAQSRLADDPPIRSIDALPDHLDFVTARTEFYTAPTVLPTVERGSIKLDLHRRDFTINTLALSLNPDRWGELLDFYGGMTDLREGVVRVLHSLSFVDDPTRILRAVRYEQRFNFRIGQRTLELLRDAIELLDRVSPARIRHELDRILEERTPEKALLRLAELQVLQQIHPALTVDERLVTRFAALRTLLAGEEAPAQLTAEPLGRLYWGLLVVHQPPAVHQALVERLGLRSETQRLMAGLAVIHANCARLTDPALHPSEAVQILDKATDTAIALYRVLDLDCAVTPILTRYVAAWQHVRPTLDGRALQALGIPRGPIYGEILAAIRAALLDGTISTPEQEIHLAQAIAGGRP
ncbi:MAG: CBS domain-containing protein [Caldilineaceae bacterium]|nr:CBS domain-containing protein [Caldilineaceae bacterium]